jgi:peptidoglycan/xylan/chitin deacetylase (PgdA/CDA1 family)
MDVAAIAGRRQRSVTKGLGALLLWLVVLLCGAGGAGAAPTVVSLTFDDGRQSQYSARQTLLDHGMRATFFLNSAGIGTSTSSWHMTKPQLDALAADGHEIGGHTIDHVRLTDLTSAEQVHQICDDRTALRNMGFSPLVSFAYPYGAYDATVQSNVRACGYTSARRTYGLRGIYCGACAFAETLPPLDLYATRAADGIKNTTSLAMMQRYITDAEANGGGWVQLVIHSVCSGCDADGDSVSLAQLTAFLDWLQPRAANGTVVKTVAEALGNASPPPPTVDTTPPTTSINCDGTACSTGWYRAPIRVERSATDAGSGVAATRYTLDGTAPTSASTAYTGPFTVSTSSTVSYRSWDNAGNVESTRTAALRIDQIAPTVAITAPADGSVVSGKVVISAEAADSASGVSRVQFYVDGALLGTSASSPYRVTWNARKTRTGTHALNAVATDAAGNSATSSVVNVIAR